MMLHASDELSKYIDDSDIFLDSSTRQNIPAIRLVMLYNGETTQNAEYDLKLSQMLNSEKHSDAEATVQAINVNAKKNQKLKEDCEPLKEYFWLIDHIAE